MPGLQELTDFKELVVVRGSCCWEVSCGEVSCWEVSCWEVSCGEVSCWEVSCCWEVRGEQERLQWNSQWITRQS